jgi:sulfide:quinone oxidoreductase
MPLNALIAGGGPAALEAALALHRLAGDRVRTTLLAPEPDFTYRPLSVLSPFAAGVTPTYPLARAAADAGFTLVRSLLASVDASAHTVTTSDGERIAYDVLLVATGARPVSPLDESVVFTGSPADERRLHGIVQDVEGGYLRRLAFVVPAGTSWALPLYELALMLAERAYSMWVDLELHLITPESAPLELFGPEASRDVAGLLAEAEIALHVGATAEPLGAGRLLLHPGGETLSVQRTIALPRLEAPSIPGLRAGPQGFLIVDRHSRVEGAPDVYAAGDITAFPIKQGGIACQQADAAAAHIAARAGAAVNAEPFRPILRGMLLTERWLRCLRRDAAGAGDPTRISERALWWPPAKIAGRELARYLHGADEAAGRVTGYPVNLAVAGAGEIEALDVPQP